MKLRFSICLVVVMLLTLNSCDQNDPHASQSGRVTFSFQKSSPDTSGGRTKDQAPAFVSYTVKKSDGSIINNKVELHEFNGSFVTQPQQLDHGHYQLELFLILGADNQAIYVAPVTGSELADLVEHPLPISFDIAENEITSVVPEVLTLEDHTPEDFGYVTFGFEIVGQDLSGLTRFDYAYMPNHTFDSDLEIQIASYVRLIKQSGKTKGWDIAFKYDNKKARMIYRYDDDGKLIGADQYEYDNGYKKILSIDFPEYPQGANPSLAHLYSWSVNDKALEYDIHFEYENNKLTSFREDNFKVTDAHYIFINHMLHYNEAGNIIEHNANGKYVTSEVGGEGTMRYNRLYEYDQTPNVFSAEFDLGKAICFYALNSFDMWNEDALPKLLSAANNTKARRKLEAYENPEAYDRRNGEHDRKLFYDANGRAAQALSEFFFKAPFDPELEIYPMRSSKAYELFTIKP